MITITLPFPPSVNHYYRRVAEKTLISEDGRIYQRQVATLVLVNRWKFMMAGRLSVDIILHPPDRRRRDVDNSHKALLDSMTKAGVWLDDSQIDDLRIRRGEVRTPATAVVSITVLTPETITGKV